jgi:hypothetical protein
MSAVSEHVRPALPPRGREADVGLEVPAGVATRDRSLGILRRLTMTARADIRKGGHGALRNVLALSVETLLCGSGTPAARCQPRRAAALSPQQDARTDRDGPLFMRTAFTRAVPDTSSCVLATNVHVDLAERDPCVFARRRQLAWGDRYPRRSGATVQAGVVALAASCNDRPSGSSRPRSGGS